VLKNPDAVQLVHMLFSPLSVIIEACRDDQGQPVIASKLDAPLLTADACQMLDGCLHPRQAELWKSLGRTWTTPRSAHNTHACVVVAGLSASFYVTQSWSFIIQFAVVDPTATINVIVSCMEYLEKYWLVLAEIVTMWHLEHCNMATTSCSMTRYQ